jgi:cytochrome c-type biogenesis protein CcmE
VNRRALKILLTLAAVGIPAAILLFSSLAESAFLYKHVDEVMTAPAGWVGKNLQVHGFVEAGSIEERIEGQVAMRTFVLEHKDQRIRVRHQGPRPDTFKDLAEVVAQGRLVEESGQYVLHADELMAKCPSKYEENRRTRDLAGPR